MEISRHREKMFRIDDLRRRLNPEDDFELWMWASMSAATNAMNAMLHKLGVTPPGRHYPHQIPGIFVEPERVNGAWRKVIVPPGDLIHIGYPAVDRPIPSTLSPFLEALSVIEDFRETHVRGNAPITRSVIAACEDAYQRCLQEAEAILGQDDAGPA